MNQGTFNGEHFNLAETLVDREVILEKSYRNGFWIGLDTEDRISAGVQTDLPPYGDTLSDPASGVYLVCLSRSGTALVIHRDSEAEEETSTVSDAPSDNGSMQIGKAAQDLPGFSGDVAEVLVYNSALSDEDRHKVESYLASRWGISI
jgi:hypothetical protein